jgi:hypothetical protein
VTSISVMAKKQKEPTVPATESPPEADVTSVLFRAEHPQLVRAIDAYAKANRRSRNMAMNLLLEEALTSHDLWPPASGRP